MVIAVVTMSPLAAVNVSCISAEKPTSLSIQLASPTIVRFPALVILPRWAPLPVPALVAVLGLVNVIVPSSPSRKGRFSEALAVMALSASAARSGRIVERLLATGHTVAVLDDFNDFYDPRIKHSNIAGFAKDVTVHHLDLRDDASVPNLFHREKFEVIA